MIVGRTVSTHHKICFCSAAVLSSPRLNLFAALLQPSRFCLDSAQVRSRLDYLSLSHCSPLIKVRFLIWGVLRGCLRPQFRPQIFACPSIFSFFLNLSHPFTFLSSSLFHHLFLSLSSCESWVLLLTHLFSNGYLGPSRTSALCGKHS